jgi:hypothetical protein
MLGKKVDNTSCLPPSLPPSIFTCSVVFYASCCKFVFTFLLIFLLLLLLVFCLVVLLVFCRFWCCDSFSADADADAEDFVGCVAANVPDIISM